MHRVGCRCTSRSCDGSSGSGVVLGDRVAVDDQGDLPVREHGGTGEGGTVGDLGRQRAGHQLALAVGGADREGHALAVAAHDDRERGVLARRPAELLGGVDDRQRAVGEDEHLAAGDRADRVVVRAGRCARCDPAGSRTGGRRRARAARS